MHSTSDGILDSNGVTMFPDPASLTRSIGRIAKLAYKFKNLDIEMKACESALRETSALASDVAFNSNRLRTQVSPATKTQIDHTIQETRSALENARKLIDSEEIAQGGIRAAVAKTKWMLQYKPHEKLVKQYNKKLQGHKQELFVVSEKRRPLDASLMEKQLAMFGALATRIIETEPRYPDMEKQGQVPRNMAIRDWACVQYEHLTDSTSQHLLDPHDVPRPNLYTIFQQHRKNTYEPTPQTLRLVPSAESPNGRMGQYISPKVNAKLTYGKKMVFASLVGRCDGVLCEIGENLVRNS
ncbi:hypothetical protein GP486_000613 [Trichoglossum hirsutum]|uniref:Uncharacterized protein n=1 Tax=Trichoglossum hirsutum TaxID=265104 RepID=A0A9P8LI87_9PEZI|nr:hypothetical protein GP486_000613 [Trichoglossum hirsutum]